MGDRKFYFLGYQYDSFSPWGFGALLLIVLAAFYVYHKRRIPCPIRILGVWLPACWLFDLPSIPATAGTFLVIGLGLLIDVRIARIRPPIVRRDLKSWLLPGVWWLCAILMMDVQASFFRQITITPQSLIEYTRRGKSVVPRDGITATVKTDGIRPYRFWHFDNGIADCTIDDDGIYVDSSGHYYTSAELANIVSKWSLVVPKHEIYTINPRS